MSKKLVDAEVLLHIETSISKLKNVLDMLTNSGVNKNLKRASLISYWIEEYSDYIIGEDCFNPMSLIRYERGDIIQVHFGYRVGNELGGLHYAVVLDNNNSKKSGILTVVPLSSLKNGFQESFQKFELTTDLHKLVEDKVSKTIDIANNELTSITEEYNNLKEEYERHPEFSPDMETKQKALGKKIKALSGTISLALRERDEICRLKRGSVVDVGQVITISKQRISNPKNPKELLYGIRVSSKDMQKITEKLMKNFL